MPVNLQKAEFVLSAVSPKNFIQDGRPQVAFAGRSNVGKSFLKKSHKLSLNKNKPTAVIDGFG